MTDTRVVLIALIEARKARSLEDALTLLDEDVQYWDCERGDVVGRKAVAAAITAADARIELETLAAAGDDAVLELQRGREPRHRSTEVYRVVGGAVISIRAYFDPDALP